MTSKNGSIPSDAQTTKPAAKKPKSKSPKKPATKPTWTLTECALAYLESLKAARKSESTISAYASDLDLATQVLGTETPIAQITLADVERFNASEPVLRTKSGRDKAMPTIERSRRVLRLALVFAEQQGALESAPIAEKPKRAKKDATTTEPAVGSDEWNEAQRKLPLHKREAIGLDDEKVKPAAAEDDPATIVYASTGEPVTE
ncbi:MAG: hypothetical protein IPN34_21475 [Planctomycetes bacterium]|nr:hypothetical protein [Planctomycetota bacterium]